MLGDRAARQSHSDPHPKADDSREDNPEGAEDGTNDEGDDSKDAGDAGEPPEGSEEPGGVVDEVAGEVGVSAGSVESEPCKRVEGVEEPGERERAAPGQSAQEQQTNEQSSMAAKAVHFTRGPPAASPG